MTAYCFGFGFACLALLPVILYLRRECGRLTKERDRYRGLLDAIETRQNQTAAMAAVIESWDDATLNEGLRQGRADMILDIAKQRGAEVALLWAKSNPLQQVKP